ncbi:MAG: phosphatidate cytidylyltransferase [Gammaproteobacteria bacterium]|nr:phosphatidate cytidylyltransferase [Gammaproteobacteria bacterium]
MSELRSRVKTAAVLLPVFVAAIVWLPTSVLAVILGAVVLLGAWEWAILAGFDAKPIRVAWVALTAAVMALVAWKLNSPSLVNMLLGAALLWWAFALVAIALYQSGRALIWPRGALALMLGWLIIIPPWLGIVILHRSELYGPGWVLCLLTIVWVADIGAYFCGRRFGKRKLASRVSPGKTVEGILGALVVGCALGLVGILGLDWGPIWLVCVLVALTVLMSVLGDLAESVMKRQAGVKDSGSILPGHGGVLDRIDSLTAAVPFFVIFAHYLRSAS